MLDAWVILLPFWWMCDGYSLCGFCKRGASIQPRGSVG